MTGTPTKLHPDDAATSVTLTVALPELRKAVASVLPHCEPTKTGDDVNDLARVRIIAGDGELLITATNGTTSALAAVPIDADSRKVRFEVQDGPFVVDVAPAFGRPFLAAFKVRRPGADAEQQWAEVTLDVEEGPRGAMTVRDVSALNPGHAHVIPLLETSSAFPDVVGILGRAMASASGSPQPKPLVSLAGPLALFLPASRAYKTPLTIEPTGTAESRGFVVQCGDLFAGTISSRHDDDDSTGKRDRARHRHLERLGVARGALAPVG